MRKHNRFGMGRPTFKCVTCHRMTRDTGQGVDHLCMECFEISGLDNQVNDSGKPCPPETLAECELYLAKIAKLGGNVERVKNVNEYIWATPSPIKVNPVLPHHIQFENVKGYKTYAAAQKRGEEIAEARRDVSYRWVVVALPSGRFAPLVVINNNVPTGPGLFLGERNVCTIN